MLTCRLGVWFLFKQVGRDWGRRCIGRRMWHPQSGFTPVVSGSSDSWRTSGLDLPASSSSWSGRSRWRSTCRGCSCSLKSLLGSSSLSCRNSRGCRQICCIGRGPKLGKSESLGVLRVYGCRGGGEGGGTQTQRRICCHARQMCQSWINSCR